MIRGKRKCHVINLSSILVRGEVNYLFSDTQQRIKNQNNCTIFQVNIHITHLHQVTEYENTSSANGSSFFAHAAISFCP